MKSNAQKYLMLTCDVEALPAEAPENHVDRLIWGRFPDAPYEAGIGLMMDIAEECGVRMVFFHDVVENLRYGAEIDRAARYIIARGHDLQLHLHIEFLDDAFWNRHGYLRPTWAMNYFNDETARIVIQDGIDRFIKMAGKPPCAFRAGAFRYNQSILKALKHCGIGLSMQYYPTTAHKSSFPHGPDAGPLPLFHWSNGVLEVPTGCLENPHPRRHGARYHGFEFHTLEAVSHAQGLMDRFWAYGPQYNVMVMVLHSWAFLHKTGSGHYVWQDDTYVRMFRDFLRSLPPDVKVITAPDLVRLVERGVVGPRFEMPLPVAGTEAFPLYRPAQAAKATEVDSTDPQPQPTEPARRGVGSALKNMLRRATGRDE